MKFLKLGIFLSLYSSLSAGEIRNAILLSEEINEVRVSSEDPLTVIFPFELSASSVKGGNITNNPQTLPASYFINYSTGSKVMDLRAITELRDIKEIKKKLNKETHMNIVSSDNKVFVIKLIHDETSNDSVITFRFKNSNNSDVVKDYSPLNLSAYLERTFTYPFLRQASSELIDNSEELGFEKVHKFANGVELELVSIVKWEDPHPNTLVFNGKLKNNNDEDIFYDRHSFSVVIGKKVMTPAITHASGVIPANTSKPFQFALTRKDYAELMAINLKENDLDFALNFEHVEVIDNPLLPELKDVNYVK